LTARTPGSTGSDVVVDALPTSPPPALVLEDASGPAAVAVLRRWLARLGRWIVARPLLAIGLAVVTTRLVMLAGMLRAERGSLPASIEVAGHISDAGWYQAIVVDGYAGGSLGLQKAAFYPGYPMLVAALYEPVKAVQRATHLPALAAWGSFGSDPLVVLAQLVVSNACLVVALVALWRLYQPRLGSVATLLGSCLLVAAPNAFFLSSGHSESAFLAATALAFLFAERGRWVAAGLACGAAALIRSPGVLVLLPLAIIWLRSPRPRGPVLAGLALALAGIVAFPAYTGFVFADPLLYEHMEAAWHPQRSNPIAAYLELLHRMWWGVREELGIKPSPITPWYSAKVQALDGVMLVWATACSFLGRIPLGLAHVLWILLAVVFPLPAGGNPISTNRYLLVAFPAFFLTGWWLRRRPLLVVPLVVVGLIGLFLLSGEATSRFVG
jgi:hypothetical protein